MSNVKQNFNFCRRKSKVSCLYCSTAQGYFFNKINGPLELGKSQPRWVVEKTDGICKL